MTVSQPCTGGAGRDIFHVIFHVICEDIKVQKRRLESYGQTIRCYPMKAKAGVRRDVHCAPLLAPTVPPRATPYTPLTMPYDGSTLLGGSSTRGQSAPSNTRPPSSAYREAPMQTSAAVDTTRRGTVRRFVPKCAARQESSSKRPLRRHFGRGH